MIDNNESNFTRPFSITFICIYMIVLASTQNTGKWQNKWLIDNYKSDIKLAHLFFLSKMSVWTGSTDRVHRESIGWVFIGQNSRCIPTGGTYHILFILPESVSIYPSWHLLLSTCNSSHQMCINNCASQLEKSSLISKYLLRAVFH